MTPITYEIAVARMADRQARSRRRRPSARLDRANRRTVTPNGE